MSKTTTEQLNDYLLKHQLDNYFIDIAQLSLKDFSRLLTLLSSGTRPNANGVINLLLADILFTMEPSIKADVQEETASSNAFFFGLACLAGLVFAFADGLDGIVSILQLLPLSHGLFVFIVSFFALLSMTVFIGFDVAEASSNLGFSCFEPNNVLSDIKLEKERIEALMHIIEASSLKTKSVDELKSLGTLLTALMKCNRRLDLQITTLSSQKDSNHALLIAQWLSAILCCLLFLSFGFFTGQAGALFLLGDLTMKMAMSQTFTAVFTLACASISSVGCAAFYWMVQRPGVENLVSKLLCGFDSESLESLESPEKRSQLSSALKLKSALTLEKGELYFENEKLKKNAQISRSPQNSISSVPSSSCFFKPVNTTRSPSLSPVELEDTPTPIGTPLRS